MSDEDKKNDVQTIYEKILEEENIKLEAISDVIFFII